MREERKEKKKKNLSFLFLVLTSSSIKWMLGWMYGAIILACVVLVVWTVLVATKWEEEAGELEPFPLIYLDYLVFFFFFFFFWKSNLSILIPPFFLHLIPLLLVDRISWDHFFCYCFCFYYSNCRARGFFFLFLFFFFFFFQMIDPPFFL